MKVNWKGVDYEVGEDRILVWEKDGMWKGMIKHADGSDGINTELQGASSEQQGRAMIQRLVKEWLEDGMTPEELGLT
jgi:hypothetical protein